MFKRYFTPKEANQTLPLVRQIVEDVLRKGSELRRRVQAGEDTLNSTEILTLQTGLETLMKELEQIGCFYKDWNFESGLVDFPSRINGREVFLCWRSDEPIVRWYHPAEDGYAGRKLIPENILDF